MDRAEPTHLTCTKHYPDPAILPLLIKMPNQEDLEKANITLPPAKANVSAAIMLLIDINVATRPTVQ